MLRLAQFHVHKDKLSNTLKKRMCRCIQQNYSSHTQIHITKWASTCKYNVVSHNGKGFFWGAFGCKKDNLRKIRRKTAPKVCEYVNKHTIFCRV